MTGSIPFVSAAGSCLPGRSRSAAAYAILLLLALPTAHGFFGSAGEEVEAGEVKPLVMPLRREVVPVYHAGKFVSIKTSYSGVIHVGGPTPQEFRVVFDTGSGHVVLPSVGCRVPACVKKARYDKAASEYGVSVHISGEPVAGNRGDSVKIGYGKGEVSGNVVSDRLCLGPAPGVGEEPEDDDHCVAVGMVDAYNMSSDPFENFTFDGIVGLGLEGLAVSRGFSFLHNLAAGQGGSRFSSGQFGVFLAEGDDEEESEIAFGGHNPERLLSPLTWVPLASPQLGYWMVEVLGVYVDGVRLGACSDGPCTGILDTGTSHLGLPPDWVEPLADMLRRPGEGVPDCRRVQAPVVKVELRGYNLTILPENYMRRLPIDRALLMEPSEANATGGANATAASAHSDVSCTARLLAVKIPSLGQNVFLLGEPALQRYYTVYDAKMLRAGLGLANRRKRQPEPEPVVGSYDEVFLVQQMRGIHRAGKQKGGSMVA